MRKVALAGLFNVYQTREDKMLDSGDFAGVGYIFAVLDFCGEGRMLPEVCYEEYSMRAGDGIVDGCR